jgi:hypothetical protein
MQSDGFYTDNLAEGIISEMKTSLFENEFIDEFQLLPLIMIFIQIICNLEQLIFKNVRTQKKNQTHSGPS